MKHLCPAQQDNPKLLAIVRVNDCLDFRDSFRVILNDVIKRAAGPSHSKTSLDDGTSGILSQLSGYSGKALILCYLSEKDVQQIYFVYGALNVNVVVSSKGVPSLSAPFEETVISPGWVAFITTFQ